MARSKKTLEVSNILDYCNKQLARTDNFADYKFKAGICVMLHDVLHSTGNYSGFRFNNPDSTEIDDKDYYSRTYYKHKNL